MQHRPASRTWLFAGAFLAAALAVAPASADYPIVSHRYLADPGFLVYNGRVYLYNSNDDDNNGGYQMHSIVCVSTSDMKNWTDHGIVFRVPTDASWAGNSWAPQPIVSNGTIYLYFGNNASGIGVASSTNPIGEFKDAKGGYLVNGSTPGASGTNSWLFDPGAFIDDDGTTYLSFGGNGETNARIIKLGSNFTSTSGSAAALAPTGFFEASFLFKRNGLYYFSYSTDTAHGLRIDYLTSSSPMSGYTYRGVLAGQPTNNNNNNHASEFEFMGQWYHAYHNRIVANTAGIDATYKRNLALEVLSFNADGTIKQVTYTTDGVPQVGTLNPYVRVEAETTKAQSGIETETCSAGGMDVTSIANGDWISVRGVDFGAAGAKSLTARVASTSAGGAIEVRSGSATGTLLGTCPVPVTGGLQTWMDTTCDISGATGVIKDLYFKFTGGGFNFDYWQFTSNAGGTGGAGGAGGGAGSGGSAGSGGNAGFGGTAGASGAGASGMAGSAGTTGGSAGAAAGGASGSSGASGSGGATAGGGTGASSGTTASGGSSAAGGAGVAGGSSGGGASGASMTAGQAGATPGAPPESGSPGGCACSIERRSAPGRASLALGLLLAAAIRRAQRRRRRATAASPVCPAPSTRRPWGT